LILRAKSINLKTAAHFALRNTKNCGGESEGGAGRKGGVGEMNSRRALAIAAAIVSI